VEELLKGEHVILGLVLILALHLVREFWKDKEKKTDESFKQSAKEFDQLKNKFDQFEVKLERFSTLISSYMETTISLNDKMDSVDKKIEELMHFQIEIKTLNRMRGKK
jgi:uncharacterized coiled-coil DUF342 family protein